MEVTYENTIDDSITFVRYHLVTDPDFKKRRVMNLYVYPLVIFIAISAFAVINKDFATVIGGLVGAMIAYTLNWVAYLRYDRKLVNHVRNRSVNEVHCPHTVTISSDGVAERTSESQSFHTWKAIARVSFSPEYIYIYITPITAHIIPLRELGDTAFQDVVAEIQKYWKS